MIRFADFIRAHAHHRPDAPAVRFDDRSHDWLTFSDRMHRAAAALRDLGIGPGDRVAYLGENSDVMVELYFAPSLIGAIFVPLNFRLSDMELAGIVNDCTPKVLVADPANAQIAARLLAGCPSVTQLILTGKGEDASPARSYEWMLAETDRPEDTAFDQIASASGEVLALFYTSGTTGRPKGVMLTHDNLLANAIGTGPIMGFSPRDTMLLSGPLFHLGTGGRVFTSVVYGVSMLLQTRFDVVETARMIAAHRITCTTLVPTMLRMVLDHPDFPTFDFSSLRLLTYGAAPMPDALLDRAMQAIPGVSFCQSFGMTEAAPVLSVLPPEDHRPDSPNASKLRSVGRPMPYCDIRIMGEDGTPLPPGSPGEIVARGPQIMAGYWNRPEETAEALRDGFYHTGDAGYLDADGYLFLVGRTKDMIITGGENVYPIETENCLSDHPAVAQVAVIGLPHHTWGEAVHAAVALHPGQDVSAGELIDHCRARIARYKAPRGVTFWDGPLPLSATSKIDKAAIRAALSTSDLRR